MRGAALALLVLLTGAAAAAETAGAVDAAPVPAPRMFDEGPVAVTDDGTPEARICALIAESAAEHGLPHDFFARLIWKESLFDPRAVSPVGAQGIAQFMPATAEERGLADPFDPEQAIPASAHLLADLRRAFGNLGLAAAAYNGGPDRVSRWLDRRGGLPWETVDYVHSITFRPVEWFRERDREVERRPLDPGTSFDEACRALPETRGRGVMARPLRSPWGVQVAGGVNRGAAWAAGARVQRSHASILGGRPLEVVRSARRTGARFAARIGAGSRREAGVLCQRLKQAGGACVVMRN